MTELDINALASWATVAVAIGTGANFLRKGNRWFDKTDERLQTLESGQAKLDEGQAKLESGQAKLEEGQASTVAELTEIKSEHASTKDRLDSIDAQLRPNGGGSHHDVIRREIREAIEEAAESNGRRHWRR